MAEITLLDGGMGQELVHRFAEEPTALWSTHVMMRQPELVGAVHADFFAAGATVATTNTYALMRDRLEPVGLEDRFEDLHAIALGQAETARTKAGGGRIAGAIGPLGASYRTDLLPEFSTAVALFEEKIRLLAPRSDVILFECVPTLEAARAAVQAAKSADKPVWISVTVDDEDGRLLRSGEAVRDLVPILKDGAAAVLANCSAPEAVAAALEGLGATGLPFGAYANGFRQITKAFLGERPTVAALEARDLGPEPYCAFALDWVQRGATLVGGCCEIGPAHIATMAQALRAQGHHIV